MVVHVAMRVAMHVAVFVAMYVAVRVAEGSGKHQEVWLS